MSQDYKICEGCHNALDFGTIECPFCGKSQVQTYQSLDKQLQGKQGMQSPINDELKKKISKFIIIGSLLYFVISTIISIFLVLHSGEHRSFSYNF